MCNGAGVLSRPHPQAGVGGVRQGLSTSNRGCGDIPPIHTAEPESRRASCTALSRVNSVMGASDCKSLWAGGWHSGGNTGQGGSFAARAGLMVSHVA